jgi:hypothetical protein
MSISFYLGVIYTQIDALRAAEVSAAMSWAVLYVPAGVTSKLINQSSCGDLMQCTFNWAKFLPSTTSGSPLLDTTACALMWSARGRLSARINWLSRDDRRTPPPWGGRPNATSRTTTLLFLCRQICHEASIRLTSESEMHEGVTNGATNISGILGFICDFRELNRL